MPRYIDADAFFADFPEIRDYEYASQDYEVDVIERKRGKWVLDEHPHDGDCRCSACGFAIDAMHERNHGTLNVLTGGRWWTFYKFCPICGAEMKGEDDDKR